jgi:hypothetical protein
MKLVLTVLGIVLATAAAFFAYYCVRLLYINLAQPGVAEHRQSGMYIGFVVFPIATIVFGWLSVRCFRKLRRA